MLDGAMRADGVGNVVAWGLGGGRWTTELEGGAGDAKRRRRYGGRRRWIGSSPTAGATATDGLTLGLRQ